MAKGLFYLSGPHKGTEEQEEYRVKMSLKVTAKFLAHGIHVFSPIVYGKQISGALNFRTLEERREFMMAYLFEFLEVSKGMIILAMDGWENSWGLSQEVKYCQKNQIPIYKMEMNQLLVDPKIILSRPLERTQIRELLSAA